MERNLLQELKVGAFVLGFLMLVLLAIYLLGGSSKMFAHEYRLHTSFMDVKGLKSGAVVRLAGIDVGEVSQVNFSSDPSRKDIEVEMTVRSEYQPRVREDSVASVSQIGVLGDMYITLSVGSPEKEMLKDGDRVSSSESVDFLAYATKATAIVENAASISKKVDLMLGTDEDAAKVQIAQSLTRVGDLLQDAKEGKGLLHLLIYDQGTAVRVKGILTNVEGVTADVRGITHDIREGHGLAHALVYGEEGEKLTQKLGDAADALDVLLTDVRDKDSLVHTLLYDPEKAQMVDEIHGALADVHDITDAVNSGEGTLGLLVRDPQMYEDVRTLLGGAERNALLRAYVRSTIARGHEENAAAWKAPEPAK